MKPRHRSEVHDFVELGGTPWRWIVLSERHAVRALVDAIDYDWLSAYKWNIWHDGRSPWRIYAKRNTGRARDTVRMHREILSRAEPDGYFDGAFGDHANGCTLDDRRLNLRWVTEAANRANVRARNLTPTVQEIARALVDELQCAGSSIDAEVPF